jgi:hypothetical protein
MCSLKAAFSFLIVKPAVLKTNHRKKILSKKRMCLIFQYVPKFPKMQFCALIIFAVPKTVSKMAAELGRFGPQIDEIK